MHSKLIYLIWFISSLGVSQTIQKFSIDSGGASAIAGNIQILYTIGEVNVQELSAGNIQISEGFINAELKININPKLFLQGPLLAPVTAGLMNDNLRSANYLPTTSPYADAATCNASVFNVTGNNAIVDWVWIELRDPSDNTKVISGKSALVQRDGDVVSLDGLSNVTINAAQNYYYVVVKHRNHIGAMSSGVIALSQTPVTIDFTNNGFSTFGSNAQVVLPSGSKALWAGDVNNNGSIKFSGTNNDVNAIKDFILNDGSNVLNFITFSSTGYLNEDVDLNGIARFSGAPNDSNKIKDNILAHPGNILNFPTYTIITTVPPAN
ncbi:MAG: hemagglutinin protein [Gelidibacter sp.]|nr:hemagglutinin protein [Gelidibacter sp.]